MHLPEIQPLGYFRLLVASTALNFFLLAFNVLIRGEKKLATRIARQVRASGGGLPAVKAKGFAIESRGLSQVSMNLCDFRQTGLAEAFRAVEAAAREGVDPQAGCIGSKSSR